MENENKNLDGIKRLSKSEIDRKRKILLDAIGEDDRKEKKDKPAEKNRNMDGILGSISRRKKRKIKMHSSSQNTKEQKEDVKAFLGIENSEKEDKESNKLGEDVQNNFLNIGKKRKTVKLLKKKDINLDDKREFSSKKDKNTFDINSVIKRGSKILKKKKALKTVSVNLLSKNNKIVHKKKKTVIDEERKAQNDKRKKSNKEIALRDKKYQDKVMKEKREKEKREKEESIVENKKIKREKRREKIKKFKHKVKNARLKIHKDIVFFFKNIKKNLKKIIYFLLILLIIFIIIYFVLFSLLKKYKLNNDFSQLLSSTLHFPAMMIDGQFIPYNDYMSKRDELGVGLALDQYFIDTVYLERIAERNNYKGNINITELKEVANIDKEVNKVGINRVQKIKQLINKDKSSFVAVSNKYGDRMGKLDYKNPNGFRDDFGSDLGELKVGEVSDVFVADDGYYIFKRFEKDDLYSLSYVFINANSLEDYLLEVQGKTKVFNYID